MKNIKSISLLGDSIFRGVILNGNRYSISNGIDIEGIADKFSFNCTNLSRFGCTIEKGSENISKYLSKGNRPDAVIIELGGNDSDFKWSEISESPEAEHLPNTPLDRFIGIYGSIIDRLNDSGITPIMTNLTPVCPERYLNWICRDGLNRDNILKWLESPATIYRYQENYSRAIERLAASKDCHLIDLRGAFLANRTIDSLFCADGIHPNGLGQKIINSVLTRESEKLTVMA